MQEKKLQIQEKNFKTKTLLSNEIKFKFRKRKRYEHF